MGSPYRLCWLVLLVTLIIPLALASNESTVFLTFIDAVSKEGISDVFIQIDINGKDTDYYLTPNESLKLSLQPREYIATFLLDNPNTPGKDYFGQSVLRLENKLVKGIFVYPVASLEGFVKDKLDNVIAGAELKFECNKAFGLNYPEKTDKFGSFSLDYVPIGNCKVYGNYGTELGLAEVELKKGEKNYAEIKLDKVLISGKTKTSSSYWWLALGLVTMLIVVSIFFYFKKKIKSLIKVEKQEKKEIKGLKEELTVSKTPAEMGQRGKDLMRTLRDNEKKIVEFILNQPEPVHLSRIHYKTGISKGALFRNLASLEQKNIIETIREGKVRKIKFSAWFLEK